MNKSGTVTRCVAAVLLFLAVWNIGVSANAGAATSTQTATINLRRSEYRSLLEQISSHHRGLSKSAVETNILDVNSGVFDSDTDPVDVVLRRTAALIQLIRRMPGSGNMDAFDQRLAALMQHHAGTGKATVQEREAEFIEATALRKAVALSNPLLDFDTLLVVEKSRSQCPIFVSNYGIYAMPGGGIFMITGIKSGNPTAHNILSNSTFVNGPNSGKRITDFSSAAFNSPDLSYDGKTILFAWAQSVNSGPDKDGSREVIGNWKDNTTFHICKVNVDGSNLMQLTTGAFNDYDPCWLPNGRIVYISERRDLNTRGGVARCIWDPHMCPCGTLHSMKADGTDQYPISWHETTEMDPSVDNNGMLVYQRWDYVDRDFSIAHHFWTCFPDGRDPRAPHGNYPKPWTTLTGGGWRDGRQARPWAEYNIRAIPNSNKYVFSAGDHHNTTGGPLMLLDISVPDDDAMSQLKRVEANTCFADETYWCSGDVGGLSDNPGGCQGRDYKTPWPLSEDFFMVGDGNQILLIDKLGNRDVLYANSGGNIKPESPIPLRPRTPPPALSTQTFQGERAGPDAPKAVISVVNVYAADQPWPPNTKIKALRVIQIIPKPWEFPQADYPKIGYSYHGIARMSLGTVPVDDDGSAYFEAPVGKEIFFQALDSMGLAIQSMRSGTFVHPGEHLSCVGCHENKWGATPAANPTAMKRPPSRLQPEPSGSLPFSFAHLVAPVFRKTCLPCHTSQGKGIQDFSYNALEPHAFYLDASDFCRLLNPLHGGSRSIPGMVGAHVSPMGKALLEKSVHQQAIKDGTISKDDVTRVMLWLDMNSNELGAYENEEAQRRGEIVWPGIDCDPANPSGTEWPEDPTPPTQAPSGLTVVSVTDRTARLSWEPVPQSADPETGIAGYAAYCNDRQIQQTSIAQADVTGLAEASAYSFAVAAVNGAKLAGPKSPEVSATTSADVTPPATVSATVGGAEPTVAIVAFSEPVTKASAENTLNYSIDNGISVQSAVQRNELTVALTLAPAPSADISYTLTVDGVQDLARTPNKATASKIALTIIPFKQGVHYDYFEADVQNAVAKIASLSTPQDSGVIAGFDISKRKRDTQFAFHFHGNIKITAEGNYTFYTTSDDGSRLLVDDRMIVDNDGSHAMEEKSGSVTLAAGMHPIEVLFFQGEGGFGLEVRWEGPSVAKQVIPGNVLFYQPEIPAATATRAVCGMKLLPGEFAFDVGPCSRAASVVQVRFAVPFSGANRPLCVQAFDMGGRMVRSLVDGPVSAGFHSMIFDIHSLSAGRYLCRMKSYSYSKTIMLTIIR
jgi:hypothetical protein